MDLKKSAIATLMGQTAAVQACVMTIIDRLLESESDAPEFVQRFFDQAKDLIETRDRQLPAPENQDEEEQVAAQALQNAHWWIAHYRERFRGA